MSIVLLGSTSGSCTLQEQAVAGTTTLTLPTFSGTVGLLVSGTAVASTSGTSIDFTSIPASVRRITVMFNGVSTNGTANWQVQIGSGSFTTSGYNSLVGYTGSSSGALAASTGFALSIADASALGSGTLVLTNISGNSWLASYNLPILVGAAVYVTTGGGSITLGGVLDRVRITTVGGTNTFDAGSINILYE